MAEEQKKEPKELKLPAIKAVKESRGNGAKTNVTNVVQVAKTVKRDPEYLTKYFGVEMGLSARFDNGSGYCVITGHHESADLQKVRARERRGAGGGAAAAAAGGGW